MINTNHHKDLLTSTDHIFSHTHLLSLSPSLSISLLLSLLLSFFLFNTLYEPLFSLLSNKEYLLSC